MLQSIRHLALTCFVCVASCLAVSAAGPEPSLIFSRLDAARFNKRAESEPWIARFRAELLNKAEDWPTEHLKTYGLSAWAPPKERGGWSGNYICPEHGSRLVFSPGHNVCPICGKDFHGWPWDYESYSRRHADNAESAERLGIAYLLSGNKDYAAKAGKILVAYAQIYPGLPIGSHKEWPKPGSRSGGRVTSQTLNESDFIRHMAFSYDMVRETLSQSERDLIERDLLRNGSDVIARRVRSLGNWTARHNSAHLAVGLVLKDKALVDLALYSEFGFRDQLKRSISEEGVWFEGSWGYHFYVASALFPTAEMVKRAGIDLPEMQRLRLFLNAPLENAFPSGVLPAFNDSGFTDLSEVTRWYDIGFRWFGDRRYLGVVRRAPRGLEAALWGAENVDDGEVPELESSVMPDIGFAALRARGSDHMVAVKFGPHAGGHSHLDRLNFVSYAFGRIQAVDPGTQSYAYKTHKTWDRVTLAHNTLVVDETSQGESVGKLLEWVPGPLVTALRLEDTTSYPGVRLERLLVHTAGYTLDVFSAASSDGKEHRFDWIYHNEGKLSAPSSLSPYADLPKTNGYQHLSETRGASLAGDWAAVFSQPDANLTLRMLGAAGTTVVAGNGLGYDLRVPVPFVMARRKGVATRYVTVLEPHRGATLVRSVRLLDDNTILIESALGRDTIRIAPGSFKFDRQPPQP